MHDRRPELGLRGEEAAARHLERNGYALLARRFRTRLGEIDIVAEKGDTLVFVEVKTRTSTRHGVPEESVTTAKQRRLALMAATFLTARGLHGRDCRFDVIAVDATPSGALAVRHTEDAFRI
ncbi:MAG TPA: YraN family protein [Verrucomicrobiae bacterium]|nr:YraN family protein [Verrucomicrobiae bacterium]